MEIEATLDQLDRVLNALEEYLDTHTILFLKGDLASGKTTLTQALLKAKGVDGAITSPTFSLQQCYEGEEVAIYHYDLYRLEHEEFMQMGLFEEFEKFGWHLVEWGSPALKELLLAVGFEVLEVEITPKEGHRIYRIEK
jgi:tRNA threonylcarbamoyladenosine biosynthesis protein TsaE